jgi:hypothetical protein
MLDGCNQCCFAYHISVRSRDSALPQPRAAGSRENAGPDEILIHNLNKIIIDGRAVDPRGECRSARLSAVRELLLRCSMPKVVPTGRQLQLAARERNPGPHNQSHTPPLDRLRQVLPILPKPELCTRPSFDLCESPLISSMNLDTSRMTFPSFSIKPISTITAISHYKGTASSLSVVVYSLNKPSIVFALYCFCPFRQA